MSNASPAGRMEVSSENEARIEKYIPKQPTKSVWKGKDKEKLWKLCKKVYKDILQKSELCNNELNGRINNCDVGVIRFEIPKNEKELESEIPKKEKKLAPEIGISVKDLLANMYLNL